MADNCQYCGGRLKKLHPAHEALCLYRPTGRPPVAERLVSAAKEARSWAKGEVELPVTNLKTVTPNVTTQKLTRAEKAKLKRAKA